MKVLCVSELFVKSASTNTHEEDRSGRPSIVSDELVQKIDEKVCENWRFTISEQFAQISRTFLYEVVTEKLGCQKFCAWCIPKMLSKNHKTQQIGSALDFLLHYDAQGEMFVNKIVIGNEMGCCT